MSVEGELRNVHTAITSMGQSLDGKIDALAKDTGEKFAKLGREVGQIQTKVTLKCEEFDRHVEGHEVVEKRKWSVFTQVAAGVILIVAGILIGALKGLF